MWDTAKFSDLLVWRKTWKKKKKVEFLRTINYQYSTEVTANEALKHSPQKKQKQKQPKTNKKTQNKPKTDRRFF